MITRLHLAFGFVVCALSVCVAEEPTSSPSGADEPGWEWILAPFPLDDELLFEARDGLVVQLERKDDELVASFSFVTVESAPDRYVERRPIALDRSGKRVAFRPKVARATRIPDRDEFVWLQRWTLAAKTISPKSVASVGIEGLTNVGFVLRTRKQAALAQIEAQKVGIRTMPFPAIGDPYDFEFTSLEGAPIKSRDYLGKVVVVDCWATWCGACMKAIPELKTLYDKWHEHGLEVIGINFDEDDETCRTACERLALPWPQVRITENKQQRKIWEQAMGLSTLPRILVLSRNGTVKGDVRPEQLAAELDRTFAATVQDSEK